MKFSECDMRQKKAWKNIKWAASDYIFGIMNGCLDNSEDSPSYKDYMNGLQDLDGIIETVYSESITNVYDEGSCSFGIGAESYLKDIRFCGKEFLMNLVKKYCKKFQAEALEQLQ